MRCRFFNGKNPAALPFDKSCKQDLLLAFADQVQNYY